MSDFPRLSQHCRFQSIVIFCRVIDNFGDIGVCWRLARQLARQLGQENAQPSTSFVQLIVDDLAVFQKIETLVDVTLPSQAIMGVQVIAWHSLEQLVVRQPRQIVIEAFGCGLPSSFLQRLAACPHPPLWINLEYLSAEPWVDSFHAVTSVHVDLPLTCHFYFPGFTCKTGGLIREEGLFIKRDRFEAADQRRIFFDACNIAMSSRDLDNYFVVSLFCYACAPVTDLFTMWEAGSQQVMCLVPEGVATGALSKFLGESAIAGSAHRRGNLTVEVISLMGQGDYDKLLWSCDLNFVRGEDSFMRAQWAGRPAIWHIYPQAEGAHWAKLDAFIDRYRSNAPGLLHAVLHEIFHAWNGDVNFAGTFNHIEALYGQRNGQHQVSAWAYHAREWANTLAQQSDLATRLLQYANKFS